MVGGLHEDNTLRILRPGCITVEGIEVLPKGWVEVEFLSIKSSSVGENTRAGIWNKRQLLLRSSTVPVTPLYTHSILLQDTVPASPCGSGP